MQKIPILLIILIIVETVFLSGCIQTPWTGGGATGATSTELCFLGFIILIIGIIAFFYVITRHKKESVIIHSPPVHTSSQPIIIREEPRGITREDRKPERRCPECGHAIPHDARLCPYCGKKFKSHFEAEKVDDGQEEKTKKESKEKTRRPKFCPECGQRLEDDVSFCTNCGTKL